MVSKTKVIEINKIAEEVKNIDVSVVDEQIYKLVYDITQERKKQKLSQKEVALLADLPQNTVSRVETFVSTPSLSVLIKLANALKLQVSLEKQN